METEFEINEKVKPVPDGMRIISPASELAFVIKKHFIEKKELEKTLKSKEEEINKILGQVATYISLYEETLNRFEPTFVEKGLKNIFREFRALKNQMVHTLEEAKISIINPTGSRLDKELEDMVEIIGWVFGEGEEQVRETKEPIILRNNEVIKQGQIIASSPSVGQTSKKEEDKDEDR